MLKLTSVVFTLILYSVISESYTFSPRSIQAVNNQAASLVTQQSQIIQADAGEYLDQVLALLREQLIANGYSTINLPNLESKFSKKIGFITFHGSASLKNGWIKGLETIARTGDALVDIDTNGDILIEALVGVNEAQIQYDMKAEFMGLGPSATVRGKLKSLQVILGVRVNIGNLQVILTKFDVKDVGTLTTYVDGLGAVFDFVVEIIINLVGNAVKSLVMELLEGTFKNLLNDILNDFLFPPTSVKHILSIQQAVINRNINYNI